MTGLIHMVLTAFAHVAAVQWQLELEPYKDLFGLDIQGGFFTRVLSPGLRQLTPLQLARRVSLSPCCFSTGPASSQHGGHRVVGLKWQLASCRVNVPRYPCGHCKASRFLLTKAWKSCSVTSTIFYLSKVSHRTSPDSAGEDYTKMWVPKGIIHWGPSLEPVYHRWEKMNHMIIQLFRVNSLTYYLVSNKFSFP